MNLKFPVIALKTLFIIGVTTLFLLVFSDISLLRAIIIGLAISFFTYAGDLLILPRVNVLAATAADVIIIAVVLWTGLSYYVVMGLTFAESLLIIAIIASGEWYLHRYLRVNIDAQPD